MQIGKNTTPIMLMAVAAIVTVIVLRLGYHSTWLWIMEVAKWVWIATITLVESRRVTPEGNLTRTTAGMLGVSFITDFVLLQVLHYC